jgi:glutamyl-tRNA synthetase
MTKVITRFAPSPTGMLHIGGARTALFNYLFAKNQGGKFFLRIEDTDQSRVSDEYTQEIIQSLQWMNIKWEEPIVIQSQNAPKHREIAKKLIEIGAAYYCFQQQEADVATKAYDKNYKKTLSPWRDADSVTYPKDINPVVRLKINHEGTTTLNDLVQGKVVIDNIHLEDVILLKSDGSPTYMLAAVCDDHEMNISHIIRGDDHLTNAFLQIQIYKALNWSIPQMAHIPLIHGSDRQKLSKRHGALSVSHYKHEGYLPDALCNYLVKLGWSHKDQEIFSRSEMETLFHVKSINKAPARLDIEKLKNINSHYIKNSDEKYLASVVVSALQKDYPVSQKSKIFIEQSIKDLKIRAKTLCELSTCAKIYSMEIPLNYEECALELIKKIDPVFIESVVSLLKKNQENFSQSNLQAVFKEFAQQQNITLAEIAAPLRALITGTTHSPSIFSIIAIIGLENTCTRITDSLKHAAELPTKHLEIR